MKKSKGKHGKRLKSKSTKHEAKKGIRTAKKPVSTNEVRVDNGNGKPKLTGKRRGPLNGSLRFEPVQFISAKEDAEHPIKPNESNESVSKVDTEFLASSEDETTDYSGNSDLDDRPVGASQLQDNNDENKFVTTESEIQVVEDEISMNDMSAIDDDESSSSADDSSENDSIADFEGDLDIANESQFSQEFSTVSVQDSGVENVEKFTSEEYDPTNESLDEPPEENSESEEGQRLRITLDDYDLSDSDDALAQDYIDNMSELDDDQIFALASGSLKTNSVYGAEDMDPFDKYLEYDEYFDELDALEVSTQPGAVSERKKLKRQARQLMHAMKFGKQPVLWQRYPEEIHVREILAELRNFANQEGASLAFPPLDNNANWYVKQLAKEHGMRPTVEGSNLQKYVVAHRTRRTTSNSGSGINKLLNRRQIFRRSDMMMVKKKRTEVASGKTKSTSARVRHGYIVGQGASEIPEDNFGHRLMKQMGWTEGSGLGKERAGIVAPIPATVKLTKTGLGGS